jgi:hypothetical protein
MIIHLLQADMMKIDLIRINDKVKKIWTPLIPFKALTKNTNKENSTKNGDGDDLEKKRKGFL